MLPKLNLLAQLIKHTVEYGVGYEVLANMLGADASDLAKRVASYDDEVTELIAFIGTIPREKWVGMVGVAVHQSQLSPDEARYIAALIDTPFIPIVAAQKGVPPQDLMDAIKQLLRHPASRTYPEFEEFLKWLLNGLVIPSEDLELWVKLHEYREAVGIQ